MVSLQNLEFTRMLPSKDGIFAFAKYSDWHYEYKFLIQQDGCIKGKTTQGLWQELSQESSGLIREKIRQGVINRNILVM